MENQSSSAPSEMSLLNAGFDPEMDKYLDLDQNAATSSSTSTDTISKSSATQSSAGTTLSNSQSQQTFSGPSFQYESYRQQTGLPAGGLANTFALNQATGMQYNGYGNGFVMPTETLNVPLTALDEFDFAAYPAMDLDPEIDSPTDNMFGQSTSSAKGGFVNPNVLLGHHQTSSGSSARVHRMYPGMHSELAAQAKGQQASKHTATSQQLRQMPQGQRPFAQNSKAQLAKDPLVEESISRLLNQMRQSSVASVEDESSTPTANAPNLARLKKDEDEMDEDERLLASEEGKKLSSKERRQLRNKVSARAFRSRRKEYIGQLEGEVAVKIEEANDLRVQNRQLMEENTRLTDLTRMLLSSQAFSGFLSELSGTGLPSSSNTVPPSQSQPQSQPTQKDVNPQQLASQLQNQQPQIGIATVPETSINFPLFEAVTSTPSWNADVGSNNFPVYTSIGLPDGPALDEKKLSGKGESSCPFQAPNTVKSDVPVIQHAPLSWMTLPTAPSSFPRYLGSASEPDESDIRLCREISSTPSDPPVPHLGLVENGTGVVKTNRLSFDLSSDVKRSKARRGIKT